MKMNASYVSYLKAAQKSERTIDTYCTYIERFLNSIDKEDTEVTFIDIINYQATLNNLSANSVRLQLASIKSYFKFLKKARLIDDNPAEEIEKPKVNPKPKHYMTENDINAMIASCRTVRDVAIVKFMVSTGVRISEMINITLREYCNAISSDRNIVITGKGNKQRRIYISESVEEAIQEYLKTRYDDCPYMFASFRRTQVDPESMGRTLKNIAKKAGIPFWHDISNHAMRAAFATIANERGVDIATIRDAMGHSDASTTSLYIKSNQSNIDNAMAVMSF